MLKFHLYIYKVNNAQSPLIMYNLNKHPISGRLKFKFNISSSHFYTQSRPVTLPRQRLTAAAGTLLARSSLQYLAWFNTTHRLYDYPSLLRLLKTIISAKRWFEPKLIDQYSPLLPTAGPFSIPVWLINLSD